jgi:hypothetical protein
MEVGGELIVGAGVGGELIVGGELVTTEFGVPVGAAGLSSSQRFCCQNFEIKSLRGPLSDDDFVCLL